MSVTILLPSSAPILAVLLPMNHHHHQQHYYHLHRTHTNEIHNQTDSLITSINQLNLKNHDQLFQTKNQDQLFQTKNQNLHPVTTYPYECQKIYNFKETHNKKTQTQIKTLLTSKISL